jgi:E3 ubiquitin-protein ligase HUWE1
VNQWSTTLGLSVVKQLSRLYRALVWEGFILLAVAANEDSKELESDSKISIPVRDPTPESGSHSTVDEARTGSREASIPSQPSVEAMDTSTESAPVFIAPGSSVEQMEDSDVVKSKIPSFFQTQPLSAASATPSLTDSLKQLTPLLTITSRVGRSLAELINLLVRLSTSPLYRTHRRGPGHTIILNNYQPPSEDAIAICTEVTNLLVESMNWEVPMPRECSPAMQSPIRDWLFAG